MVKMLREWLRGAHPMYEVVIARDEESGQFYVHESDVIGLNACADTIDELIAIIQDVAPDLIEHNHRARLNVLSFLRPAIDPSNLRITHNLRIPDRIPA